MTAGLLALARLLAGSAGAESAVLVERIGKLEHAGRAWECELFSTHPQLKGREQWLQGLVAAAAARPVVRAPYKAARVPSVEITAYARATTKTGKRSRRAVVLLKDYGAHEQRQGAEAQELIALTQRLCEERIQP